MKRIFTFTVFILALLVVILWTAYISLRFDSPTKNNRTLESDFWIFKGSSALERVSPDEYYFSPLSVSLILSGEGYTSAHNETLTRTLYDSHKPLLKEIFSSKYTASLSNESTFENALATPDAVYIEYPDSIPSVFISRFLGLDETVKGEVITVKSVIIFGDEKNVPTAMLRDGNGQVYSLLFDSDTPSLIYDFNSSNLAAYTVNKGFTEFDFNLHLSERKKNPHLPSEYVVLSNAPDLPSAVIDLPMNEVLQKAMLERSALLDLLSDHTLYSLFDAFEINPNIVGFYSDMASGLFFVGDDMSLSVDTSGNIEYNSEAGNTPVTLSSLLNSDKAAFNATETLTAATVFLGRFSSFITGKEAVPVLDGVYYSEKTEELTFRFGYYFELTEILLSGKRPSIFLTFDKNGLKRAYIPTLSVSKSDLPSENGEYLDMSIPHYAVSGMLDDGEDFSAVYNFTEASLPTAPIWMKKGDA